MLTRRELLALERSTRSDRVLTVYIDGTETDVATQEKWRLDLAHSLRDLRSWLDGSPHDERAAFDECVGLLEQELSAFEHTVGAPGWVAFITADGVKSAERVPVAAPTLAVWSTGASIAPYMRILKEARPVLMLMVDARKGRLFRYRHGELKLMKTFHSHAVVEGASHMGNAPRAGFHAGVHGVTGRDAAQRSLQAGTRRMLRELAREAVRLAGSDGWILTGGIPVVARHLSTALERHVPGRVRVVESLDVHATMAQIAVAVRQAASTVRSEVDQARLEEIVEHANDPARAALGRTATLSALQKKRVRDLYLTHRYLEEHAEEAEGAVRAALDQDAVVEHVSHDVGRWLDERGGIAALLRSAPRRRQAT